MIYALLLLLLLLPLLLLLLQILRSHHEYTSLEVFFLILEDAATQSKLACSPLSVLLAVWCMVFVPLVMAAECLLFW